MKFMVRKNTKDKVSKVTKVESLTHGQVKRRKGIDYAVNISYRGSE